MPSQDHKTKKFLGRGRYPSNLESRLGVTGAKPRKNFLGRELALTPSVAKVPSKRVLRSFAERKRQATFPETDTEVPIRNLYSASVIARILAYSAVLPSQVVCTPVRLSVSLTLRYGIVWSYKLEFLENNFKAD